MRRPPGRVRDRSGRRSGATGATRRPTPCTSRSTRSAASSTCPLCLNAGLPGPPIPGEAQNPIHLDRVCVRFPELKLCMMHGADPWWDVAIRLMIKYPNLHLMTSAWAPKYLPESLLHYMRDPRQAEGDLRLRRPGAVDGALPRRGRQPRSRREVLDAYLYRNAQEFFFSMNRHVYVHERIAIEGGGRGRMIEMIRTRWAPHLEAGHGVRLVGVWATVGSTADGPKSACSGRWTTGTTSRVRVGRSVPDGGARRLPHRAVEPGARLPARRSLDVAAADGVLARRRDDRRTASPADVVLREDVRSMPGRMADVPRGAAVRVRPLAEARGLRLLGAYEHAVVPNTRHSTSGRCASWEHWKTLMEAERRRRRAPRVDRPPGRVARRHRRLPRRPAAEEALRT